MLNLPKFARWSLTDEGKRYARICHSKIIDTYEERTWIFGKWIHRDDDLLKDPQGSKVGSLPAIICCNGDQYWYKYGKCHRENDLPAVIYNNGIKYWYQQDTLYRDDGPTIFNPNDPEYKPRFSRNNKTEPIDQGFGSYCG